MPGIFTWQYSGSSWGDSADPSNWTYTGTPAGTTPSIGDSLIFPAGKTGCDLTLLNYNQFDEITIEPDATYPNKQILLGLTGGAASTCNKLTQSCGEIVLWNNLTVSGQFTGNGGKVSKGGAAIYYDLTLAGGSSLYPSGVATGKTWECDVPLAITGYFKLSGTLTKDGLGNINIGDGTATGHGNFVMTDGCLISKGAATSAPYLYVNQYSELYNEPYTSGGPMTYTCQLVVIVNGRVRLFTNSTSYRDCRFITGPTTVNSGATVKMYGGAAWETPTTGRFTNYGTVEVDIPTSAVSSTSWGVIAFDGGDFRNRGVLNLGFSSMYGTMFAQGCDLTGTGSEVRTPAAWVGVGLTGPPIDIRYEVFTSKIVCTSCVADPTKVVVTEYNRPSKRTGLQMSYLIISSIEFAGMYVTATLPASCKQVKTSDNKELFLFWGDNDGTQGKGTPSPNGFAIAGDLFVVGPMYPGTPSTTTWINTAGTTLVTTGGGDWAITKPSTTSLWTKTDWDGTMPSGGSGTVTFVDQVNSAPSISLQNYHDPLLDE